MFADGVLEQAVAELKKTADTPAKKILVEFLETHIDEIKAYRPRMVTLDATSHYQKAPPHGRSQRARIHLNT